MTKGTVGPVFAAVLAAERELFNAKLAEARRRRPDLDPAALFEFLREPGARLVEQAEPERARELAHAVYDAALVLIGERIAGPGGRHAVIDRLWRELLPALGPVLSAEPVRVIGSLTNATFQLASTPGARPEEFVDQLAGIVERVNGVEALLAVGQIAAWRSGLAHFRQGAIAIADGVPELACALLGGGESDWSSLREKLRRDPWWDPAAAAHERFRLARSVGAFRGFGGVFAQPPQVFAVDGQLFASAAGECFQVCADVFGATLHRTDPEICRRAATHPTLQLFENGARFEGWWLPLPALGRVTSGAAVPSTVAVTGALSHSVSLFAVG